MTTLKDKVIFITGASRGIGREIALRCAQEGAKIIIAAKTAEPHPKLEGTIYTVAKEVEQIGGKALPLVVDVRDDQQIQDAINKAVDTFGGIDILVNNASAINLTKTLDTPMRRFDLMMQCQCARHICLFSSVPAVSQKIAKSAYFNLIATLKYES